MTRQAVLQSMFMFKKIVLQVRYHLIHLTRCNLVKNKQAIVLEEWSRSSQLKGKRTLLRRKKEINVSVSHEILQKLILLFGPHVYSEGLLNIRPCPSVTSVRLLCIHLHALILYIVKVNVHSIKWELSCHFLAIRKIGVFSICAYHCSVKNLSWLYLSCYFVIKLLRRCYIWSNCFRHLFRVIIEGQLLVFPLDIPRG